MKSILTPQRKKVLSEISTELVRWYRFNHRPLPWRADRDPYRIWISEVMLQQTTVQAVVPYYERFTRRFPTLENLSKSNIEEVLELWSGLGYYSRARNLHKAAQDLVARGANEAPESWPKQFDILLKLSGFGPYISRAVASLAFGEPVGVLDGNVIRVLSRHLGEKISWWKPSERAILQDASDYIAQSENPYYTNQALMELGATVCTTQNPNCGICPIAFSCSANKLDLIENLPLKKQRKNKEFWIWKPILKTRKIEGKIKLALIKNTYAPFLKNQYIFPGFALKKTAKPKKFAGKHSITHHDIYIQPDHNSSIPKTQSKKICWIDKADLKRVSPSSLLKKAMELWSVAAIISGGQQLTFLGDNSQVSFSGDSEKIVYSSRNRPRHSNAQIYEYALSIGKEKRITYSDGQALDPSFSENNKSIFYYSDTDIIKEKFTLFSPPTIKDPNTIETDLYEIDPVELKIDRIVDQNKKKPVEEKIKKLSEKSLHCPENVVIAPNRKRAITIQKKEGLNQLVLFEYSSPVESCESLNKN